MLWNRLLFITLIIICETEIREINTSLAIQCMQACTQGCYKTINTDFKRNNTPFVLNISQRNSEGRTGPPTHLDQIRVGQNAATLSQAVPAWLRPLSNIISHTLFQLSMNRVLWNRLLMIMTLAHCAVVWTTEALEDKFSSFLSSYPNHSGNLNIGDLIADRNVMLHFQKLTSRFDLQLNECLAVVDIFLGYGKNAWNLATFIS